MERIRTFVAAPAAGVTIESVLAQASGDPALRVAYWNDGRASYVSEQGWPREFSGELVGVPGRDGGRGAVIAFDPARAPVELVRRLGRAASPELENARLRAAISLQLEEVRDSRRRILSAQMEERKRIERDLHDGSQQRLLALAMNLRATELGGDPGAAMRALPGAVSEIQATVRELRELANGLYPEALADGGLSAALQEFAARAPMPIELEVTEGRFPPHIESAAWFIACEAIANVVKHAQARTVSVVAEARAPGLVLTIEDDGAGGADPRGHGLRGLADRAEAVGGQLSVNPRVAGGTSIRALLPCEL
jgi:signal transduction histidine kinase